MYTKFLQMISVWCTDHSKKVFLVTFLITLLFGALAATLNLNLSFLAIMPDGDSEVELFKNMTDKFGGSSDLLLVIEGKNPQQSKEFAEELSKKLYQFQSDLQKKHPERAKNGIRSIEYRIDTRFFDEYGMLFADDKMLSEVQQVLDSNRDWISWVYQDMHLVPHLEKAHSCLLRPHAPLKKGQILQILKMINASMEIIDEYVRKGATVDKAEVHRKVAHMIGTNMDTYSSAYLNDGYIFSPDGKIMLMTIRLNVDILHMPLGIAIYNDIKAKTQEILSKEEYKGLTANYTGMIAMGCEDQTRTIAVFQWLSFVSLILVALLFFYISGLRMGPILVGIPMMCAMIWTFGFVKLGIGFVSLTSMIFAVLLFGLGIDFAIHLMARIGEEHRNGSDYRQAIQKTIQTSGRGIITGALTTAAAFFCMCLARDKSASHLGFTTGWGLVCCLITMMILFPALLYHFFQNKKEKFSEDSAKERKNLVLNLWVSYVVRFPYVFLAICVLSFLFFGYQVRHFRMEYDLENIIQRGLPSIAAKKKVLKKFGHTNDFLMIMSKNLKQDREFTEKLQKSKIFADVLSISKFLPTQENQKKKLARMARIYTIIKDVKVHKKAKNDHQISSNHLKRLLWILKDLQTKVSFLSQMYSDEKIRGELEILEKHCTKLSKFMADPKNDQLVRKNLGYMQFLVGQYTEKFLEKLKKMSCPFLRKGKKIISKNITLEKLPDNIKNRFISQKDSTYLIMAYPKNPSMDLENINEIQSNLEKIAPKQATGMLLITKKFVTSGLRDFPLISGSIILVLLVILLADFRSIKSLIFAGLPLLFSAVISMGIVCMSGATISILMLSAFPLIFGIGIDDGVHILHRYKEDKDVVKAVSHTGRAIFLTTVTTMVSFGVLLFTNHSGLIGMGMLVGIGVTLCFVFSVTILPAILVIFGGKNASSNIEDVTSKES